MNSNAVRPYRNTSYIDYLVGWKFLFNKDYRDYVRERWTDQPWFLTGTEIASGIGSIFISILFPLLIAFFVADAWFL
ncbi:MAG: hypothetical protein JAY99_14435 [Candidatus Thiodiazotropha lotti]|uniref:Uncharacterized protein n=1 Tax=Candidatus Thiodiazotropha endoloripes TaxID=1818881 RepID=A0A1E2UGX9_9GAMM|nr:hypothetical protein [Candidatus Thiodiazotropha endoloripes]MCG7897411.1 hypothetical protein [Candidatus Thiodiazotropha weberae]MCG7992942.1 hypothetical protein [Candidatus Thiodiazotropha lotti]MCG7904138.1 hypothetical protein [Candidatus Thiodiazotropha weberae]MCG7915824.1 hypothetical protein [Candidatus Thiodiazotropha weberae]MCG8000715.1 hypothetical protein [Candidatus Thiodiazotropha lotti]